MFKGKIVNPTPEQQRQREYMRDYQRLRRAGGARPQLSSTELSVLHLQKLQRAGYCPRCGNGNDRDNTSLEVCELCLSDIANGAPIADAGDVA